MDVPALIVPGAAYTFHTTNGTTKLTLGERVLLADGEHKVTAFKAVDKRFINLGTAIFVVPGTDKGLVLRWVTRADSAEQTTTPAEARNTTLTDTTLAYQREMATLLRNKGTISGLNRFYTIDWEWPFRMPGWTGLREIGVPVPGWYEALPWLEFHAVGSFGLASFDAADEMGKKSLFGVAVGAIGYLTGYECEKVDDTSSQFCSFGTNNDCDDFAVAAASLVTAALKCAHPKTSLHRWIKDNVQTVYVVSGMAWPKCAIANGKKVTCGHMWVEAILVTGEVVVVECTAGVAYYGLTPTSATVREGSLDEYISRDYIWHEDKVEHRWVDNGEIKVASIGDQIQRPDFVERLAHKPPHPNDDPDYMPTTIPRQITLYGSYPSRLTTPPQGHISVKFIPFTVGTTWFITDNTLPDPGSYRAKPGSYG